MDPDAVARIGDAGDRARQAGIEMDARLAEVEALARIRDQALGELVDQGLSNEDIAGRIGTSEPRVSQLLKRIGRPGRRT